MSRFGCFFSKNKEKKDQKLFDSNCFTNNYRLWQVGFDYLREAGKEGLSHLELLIAEVPLNNETVATKLCSLCDEVGFDQTRKDIARTMAYR